MHRPAIALVVMMAAFGAAAQQTPAATKEQRVRELLTATRAANLGVQVVDAMIAQMKEGAPNISDEFLDNFRKRVKPEELTDMLVPIYAKHLSSDDIEDLIKFYQSPAGQHLLDKQPAIMQESMKAGAEWGERIAKEAIEEMQQQKDKSNP